MEHVLIAFYIIVVFAGGLSLYYSLQLKRIHPIPFLSCYSRFILFFCLLVLYYLLSIYFHINLLKPLSPADGLLKYYSLVRFLIFFSIIVGLVFFFIRSVWHLIHKPISLWYRYLFFSSLLLFVFSYGVGAALFIRNNSYKWIFSTHNGLLIWKMTAAVTALIFLLYHRLEFRDPVRKRMINTFAVFYSLGFILFYVTLRLPAPKIAGGSLNIFILFLFAIFPSFWLKKYFKPGFDVSQSPLVNKHVLDEITEKFHLTKREREILELILKGQSSKEIMRALFLSHGTVRNHTTNLYHKIGVDSRMKLIQFVLKEKDNVRIR